MTAKISTQTHVTTVSQRAVAGVVCLLAGAAMIFVAGLSNISYAHNAAHDTRHAIGFPCH